MKYNLTYPLCSLQLPLYLPLSLPPNFMSFFNNPLVQLVLPNKYQFSLPQQPSTFSSSSVWDEAHKWSTQPMPDFWRLDLMYILCSNHACCEFVVLVAMHFQKTAFYSTLLFCNGPWVSVAVVAVFRAKCPGSYSQDFDQQYISPLTATHCKKKNNNNLLWPRFRVAKVYEYKHKYLQGNFTYSMAT